MYKAKIKTLELKDILFTKSNLDDADLSLDERSVKYKNFIGFIHNPQGDRCFEKVSQLMNVTLDDSFILKKKIEDQSDTNIIDNVAMLQRMENELCSKLLVGKDELFTKISSYLSKTSRISESCAKDIDRYIISIHSNPTCDILLSPKSEVALKNAKKLSSNNITNDFSAKFLGNQQKLSYE